MVDLTPEAVEGKNKTAKRIISTAKEMATSVAHGEIEDRTVTLIPDFIVVVKPVRIEKISTKELKLPS